jgi:pimeloyl-ACP methyl ester carboxylesterase
MREPPTLDQLADAVLEQTKSKTLGSYALAGLSLGGLIAARIAERGEPNLLALTLVSVRALAPSLEERAQQQRILDMAARIGRGPVLEGLATQMFGPRHRRERPAQLAAWIAEAASWRAESLRGLAAAVGDFAVVDALRHEVPTLVLRGENDPLVSSSDLEQLASTGPSVCTRTLPQAGHLVPCEQPRDVASAIETWEACFREPTRAG